MLKHIKLIIYRIKNNKAFLITYLVLIPLILAMAVYFTNSISYNMQIGVVGNMKIAESDKIDYVYLDTLPTTSELVLNQYDAILIQARQDIEVISTKGEEYNQAVKLLINGQIESLTNTANQRGTASNILGFLMMIISLLGVQLFKYYFDERSGINKRILGTSIHCYQYLVSHFIVVFGFLFIPAAVVICSVIYIFNIVLSIAMWKFLLVLLLLCFFASVFGLIVNVLSRTLEESMMFGNMFAIIGAIVSGAFVKVTDNQVFNTIIQIFPQKQIMSLLEMLENNIDISYGGLFYVMILTIVLIGLAIIIEKKKLPNR